MSNVTPKYHHLKCWPEFFKELAALNKTFEVRKNDRDFKVGDILVIEEFMPDIQCYTDAYLNFSITYILQGGQFGIEKDYVILSLVTFLSCVSTDF